MLLAKKEKAKAAEEKKRQERQKLEQVAAAKRAKEAEDAQKKLRDDDAKSNTKLSSNGSSLSQKQMKTLKRQAEKAEQDKANADAALAAERDSKGGSEKAKAANAACGPKTSPKDPDTIDKDRQWKQTKAMSAANEAFKAGLFDDAYEGYGAALRIDENNISMASKLLCNRAIAALKLKRFEHAIQDASAALFFNPQYAKAYATRAAAHVELDW